MCFRSSNLLFRLPPPPFNHSQRENLFERLKVLAQLLRPRSSHAIRNPPVWMDMAFLPETAIIYRWHPSIEVPELRVVSPDWRAIDVTDAARQVAIKALVVGPTEALDPTERRSGSRMRIKCGGQTDWLGWWWSVRLLSGCSKKREPVYFSGYFFDQNCRISFPTSSMTGPGKLFRLEISRIITSCSLPSVEMWSLASQGISSWWRAHSSQRYHTIQCL